MNDLCGFVGCLADGGDVGLGFLAIGLKRFVDIVVLVAEEAELELWEDGMDMAVKLGSFEKSARFLA